MIVPDDATERAVVGPETRTASGAAGPSDVTQRPGPGRELASALPPAAPGAEEAGPFRPGETLGKYEIQVEIARGGMGVVYRARDRALKRDVALKVMLESAPGAEDRKRFFREAEAAARLQHAYVCQVYDVGEDRGVCYFAMELVEGEPLHRFVRLRSLPPREVLALFAKVCEGVHYAHMHGVIHRDLKPANVLVDARGNPKVMDFGIAKQVALEPGGEQLTVAGAIMGTPSYMSPEQARGGSADVDVRSDVFALGVILYELLAGRAPFEGKTLTATLYSVVFDEPAPLRALRPELDWEVEAIVARALEKDREARYRSALDMAEDIGRYLAGRPIRAKKTGTLYRLRKFVARHPGPVGAAALATLAVAGAIGFVAMRWAADRREREARRDQLIAEAREEKNLVRALAKANEALALDAGSVEAQLAKERIERAIAEAERRREEAARAEAAREQERRLEEEARTLVEKGMSALDGIGSLEAIASVEAARATADRLKKIEETFIAALAKKPDLAEANDGLAGLVQFQAGLARRLERLESAARVAALVEAGERALAAKEHVKAIEAFDDALKLDPQSEKALRGRADAGLAFAEAAIAERRFDLAEFALGAVARLDTARAARATEALARARVDEGRLWAELDAAAVARFEGRTEAALAGYRKALALDPRSRAAMAGQAWCEGALALAAERFDEAIERFGAARDAAEAALEREDAARMLRQARERAAARALEAAEDALARRDFEAAGKAVEAARRYAPEDERAARLLLEIGRRSETPAGMVYIAASPGAPRAFYIARHETTNAEYAEFVAAGGYAEEKLFRPEAWARRAEMVDREGAPGPAGWARGKFGAGEEQLPVTGISYFEAEAYARWRGARLPSEEEWARAVGLAPWQRQPEAWEKGWSAYFDMRGPRRSGETTPVADRSESGIEDGFGNVSEWCAPGVVRGGSFASIFPERAAPETPRTRDPWLRSPAVGLRLARDAREGTKDAPR